MIFFVYATETNQTIGRSLGLADYSYYFVMKKFLPVLRKLGRVIVVGDLAAVNARFNAMQAQGHEAILLSFTPPQRTPLDLRCPTFPVFAWEFSTIPNESWGNEPRHDWTHVLKLLPGAITHSRFTVHAVHEAMGAGYPVVPLPAPLWDEYAPLYREEAQAVAGPDWVLNIAKGVVLDSHALGLQQAASANAAVAPAFVETQCSVRLGGVIYTSVFNPNDSRKNWLDLVSGFCFAFRDNPDATLVMKLAFNDTQFACSKLWQVMKMLAPYRCRVVAVQGYLKDAAYRKLVANSTYVVNTAHGEGQCLPLMEFMSAGKPAIAPDHSAMADYIDAGNAFVVRSSEEWTHWPHDPRMMLRTFRYRINWESLRDAYLASWRVATSQPGEYLRMSRQAHQTLRQHCSRKAIAQKLKEFLEGLGYAPKYRAAPILDFVKLIARLRK